METGARLAEVIKLLQHLPIQQGSSDREPWVKVNLIDLTKLIDVACGLDDPEVWVGEPCGKPFGHSPHHWSEYREGETPLRVPHYCDGSNA